MFWLVSTNGDRIVHFMTEWMHKTYWRTQKKEKGQMITHQNTDKLKLSLQVQNSCNSRNVNQCNICRSRPTGENQTQIKG